MISKSVAQKLLDELVKFYSLNDREEALAALSILLQQGATARSCDGNMAVTIFKKEFRLPVRRKRLTGNNLPRGERKLARTYGDQIVHMAVALEIPGNLYS